MIHTSDILDSPLLAQAEDIIARARLVKAPPPDLTVSQWADDKRKISGDNNAEPGDWRKRRRQRALAARRSAGVGICSRIVRIVGTQSFRRVLKM